jgi:ubiquinone/menaquinone biosynthesis C-methylase UbiE
MFSIVFRMGSEKKRKSFMDQYKCPTGIQGRVVAVSMNQRHSELTSWGLKNVKINPHFVVLDVGCGGGKTVSKLAKLAFQGKVFGLDHSQDMVEFSKEVNKELIAQGRVAIVEDSVEKMSFPDGSFDLVTAVETYYFWSNLSDAFREIKRVLKTKGNLLLLNEMIKDGVYEVENMEIITKTQVCLVPLQEIRKVLESIGFANIEIFTKSGSPWNAVLAQKL